MNINFEDTDIIRQFEGHSLKAYPDPATGGDPYTISYGLTGPWVKPGLVITEEESKKKFMEYIQDFSTKLSKLLTKPATKNQFVAMLSLSWNIGTGQFSGSSVLKKFNAGDIKGAADSFLLWNKANKKVMAGLTRRREAERVLFLKA